MEWTYTDLMEWDDSSNNVPNIDKLDISDKNLTKLPLKIFKLTSLRTFYCNNNQLTKLPKELGRLTSLNVLYCSDNKLAELPKEIGQLTSLYKLYCSNNKLTKLPKEIDNDIINEWVKHIG